MPAIPSHPAASGWRSLPPGPGRPPAALPLLALQLAGAAAVYGASFGWWRGGLQIGWSALKFPLLLFSVTATCALANFMAAQVLGLDLSLRQTLRAMLRAFTMAALVLAGLAPVFWFLAVTLPGPHEADALASGRLLLLLHTAAVGLAGVLGNLHLWHMLRAHAGQTALAARVLAAWLVLGGIAGSELSWIFSPFLTHPHRELTFLNPNAFRMNMYEYLWRLAAGRLDPAP